MTNYTSLGNIPIIPAADLLDLQSQANKPGNGSARVGEASPVLGKKAGQLAFRDAGSSAYSLVFALGANSYDAWELCDGSATYTPVNLGSWTVGADSTYSAGLITTDAGDDAAGRATQSITLTAGEYVLSGTAAAEGTLGSHVAPRIRVGTTVSNGDILTDIFETNIGTVAEDVSPKEEVNQVITVATTGTVHFTIDVVDEAGALAAGSAFLSLNLLQSRNS
jgi:hypothetical protein